MTEKGRENPNIVLTGFMGTGKTTIGRMLSRLTGFLFVDADAVLEKRFGRSVPEIFRLHGERAFRKEERRLAAELAELENTVIATGGGMMLRKDSREALERTGELFRLEATAETILERTRKDRTRPLIGAEDPEESIRKLLATREQAYRNIEDRIETDGLSPHEVALQVLERLKRTRRRLDVRLPGGTSYPVFFGRGCIAELPHLLAPAGAGPNVLAVTDSNVEALHGDTLRDVLGGAGCGLRLFSFPAGEGSKTMDTVNGIHAFLAGEGAQRDAVVIAFGGGVVGDVAGFAASTYMRGIRVVHVPTTLLAQVDASIGGKTAVNRAEAKNLVGTFHQPLFVLSDPRFLLTLPGREFVSGLAEVVKTAVIEGEDAVGALEMLGHRIGRRELPLLEPPMWRAVVQKSRIVSRDPFEEGERKVLNLGHTFGHAIETAGGYRDVSHGEAVARGMVIAARLSERMGAMPAEEAVRIEKLISRLGLLDGKRRYRPGDLLKAMYLDKKGRRGNLTIILPERPGRVSVREDVDPDTITRVLEEFDEEHFGHTRAQPEEAR